MTISLTISVKNIIDASTLGNKKATSHSHTAHCQYESQKKTKNLHTNFCNLSYLYQPLAPHFMTSI